MQKGKNLYLLPVYFFCLGGLLSCGLPQSGMNAINFRPGVNVTNIRDIKLDRENESTIYLRGKVVKQVPLLERQVYQLQDLTGTVWVVTNQAQLQLQDQVLIKGNVRYQSIPQAGKDFGEVFVVEHEQLERSAE